MVGEPIPLLITGASGYLGSHLVRRAGPAWRPVGTYLTARPPVRRASRPPPPRPAPSLFVDEFRCPPYAPDPPAALLDLAAAHPSAASGARPAPSSTSAGSARTPSSASGGSAQVFEGVLH